jgi:tetratricopeptide (TPR) repeat protein
MPETPIKSGQPSTQKAPAKPAAPAAAKPASPAPAAAKAAQPAQAAKPAAPPPAAAQAEPDGPDVTHPDAKKLGLKAKDAAKFLRQAVSLYDQQDYVGAVDAARLAVACNNKAAPHWVIFGASFARVGRLEYAKMAFDRALELDPSDIGCWVSLGELQIAQKDFSAAMKALQKAVELDKTGQHPAARRARMLIVSRKQWTTGISR